MQTYIADKLEVKRPSNRDTWVMPLLRGGVEAQVLVPVSCFDLHSNRDPVTPQLQRDTITWASCRPQTAIETIQGDDRGVRDGGQAVTGLDPRF